MYHVLFYFPMQSGLARLIRYGLVIAIGTTLIGCSKGTVPPSRRGVANIVAKSGSDLMGHAVFTETKGKVKLVVEIENASPGIHAVHIHAKGDCSSADGKSAGGHWNPTDKAHGKWGNPPFHSGDIGNLVVGADGKGKIELTADGWSIDGTPETNVIGKAIIVHAGADDFTSQPSGNAGKRIGCGEITLAQ